MSYALVALLFCFLCWKGIIPALTRIDTDFPNYYTSSRLFLEGKDLSRMYDDSWFAGEVRSHGMNLEGKFSPFPPPTIFVMLPIAILSPASALKVWTLISLAGLVGIIVLLSKIVHVEIVTTAIVVLLGGIGLANNFRFGQFYVILLFLIVSGYYFWAHGSSVLAGIAFGIGASFKYFPIIYLFLFILRKDWKGASALLGTIALINLLCLTLTGVTMYQAFISDVLVRHLSANMQNPFSATFQSWPSLFRRIFVTDQLFNPYPVFNWYPGFVITTISVTMIILTSAFRSILEIHHSTGEQGRRLEFVILSIATLSVLPASATYHYVLLTFPVILLLQDRGGEGINYVYLILALYIVIGFIPYHYFTVYDGQGILSILAYPRLFIMTAMVGMVVRFASLINRASTLPQPITVL